MLNAQAPTRGMDRWNGPPPTDNQIDICKSDDSVLVRIFLVLICSLLYQPQSMVIHLNRMGALGYTALP